MSEQRFRGLLEAAPDAMVVTAPNGEIILLNVQTERQFGYRRTELTGQQVRLILPDGLVRRPAPDVEDETEALADEGLMHEVQIHEIQAQRAGAALELRGRRKDGGEFPVEIMVSSLESAEGILTTAAIRDVTERRNFEKELAQTATELRRSNIELEQFAYVASHDLQEPLRMVASYVQLLVSRYRGHIDSDADDFIDFAVDGCKRMKRLIENLLAYSRAGTNEKPLRKVAGEEALKAALNNLRPTIEESGAVITHDGLPALMTDETQLAQVFQNLVGNAIKYRAADAPRVHVSATKNARREWIFAVRDNGIGIDPRYSEKIFILFQRLHGPRDPRGSGIGLAVCKKILERLGGRIWVESQPGKGSTFYFALPELDES